MLSHQRRKLRRQRRRKGSGKSKKSKAKKGKGKKSKAKKTPEVAEEEVTDSGNGKRKAEGEPEESAGDQKRRRIDPTSDVLAMLGGGLTGQGGIRVTTRKLAAGEQYTATNPALVMEFVGAEGFD